MPRSGPGTYALPPNVPDQQPNTTIQSAWANSYSADVETTFNTAWPVALGGTGTTDLKFDASQFGIKDGTDPTKQVIFNLSGLPTATTRTWTAPYYSGTLGLVSDIRGQIYGLTLSNNVTDSANDIDFGPGSAVDSTGAKSMLLATTLTKRLDAAWVVGNNQGGLDTGSIANTTYHCYEIMRPDTMVVDCCFSANGSGPTIGAAIPAAYTLYRRVGSITRTAAAGGIVQFTQQGDEFLFKAPTVDITTNTLSTSGTLFSLPIPGGFKFNAIIAGFMSNAAANTQVYFSSPDVNDIAASSNGPANGASAGIAGIGYPNIRTNTSAQIRARSSAANTTLSVSTLGWIDNRGKDY